MEGFYLLQKGERMSTFAYLGEVGNRDLNDLCCYNGFFAVNDPTVVHTLNNYPDDSDLTYKIAFQYDTEIKPYIQCITVNF